jgi:exonuclease III
MLRAFRYPMRCRASSFVRPLRPSLHYDAGFGTPSALDVVTTWAPKPDGSVLARRIFGEEQRAGTVTDVALRIATWNCYRGDCLVRAAELAPLDADVAILQECSQPRKRTSRQHAWFGSNPSHGVGIVARTPYRVRAGPADARFDHTAYPAVITGPVRFHVLAIWAMPRPSYVRALLDALDVYDDFLRAAPSIVVGDFNCFAQWQGSAPSKRHVELARRLADDFGLVSAYHAAPDRDAQAAEHPTHFWRWREHNPFHIDYCFVPSAWRPAIRTVHVSGFAEQHWRSDHRPVVVELALPASGRGRSVPA